LPRDRTYGLKQVTAEIHSLRRKLADATTRRDEAVTQLEDLGPVGRRIRRNDRKRLENELRRSEAAIVATATRLVDRSSTATLYGAETHRRRCWEVEHEPDQQRLCEIQLTLSSREAAAVGVVDRSFEGRELGIDL